MPAPRKITLQQVNKLIEYMENHREVACSLQVHSKEDKKAWEEITYILNRTPGYRKSLKQWKNYWSEFKYKARMKAAKKRLLNTFEKRIYDLVGPLSNRNDKIVIYDLRKMDTKLEPEEGQFLEEEVSWDKSYEVEDSTIEAVGQHTEHDYTQDVDPSFITEIIEDNQEEEEEEEVQENHNDITKEEEVPKWVRDVEQRRLALEERTAAALENMAESANSMARSIHAISRAMLSMVNGGDKLGKSFKTEP